MNELILSHKRVRYFDGQLLTAEDLQAEQQYFLNRLRLHNRYLHGHGVVSGLKVSTSSDSSSSGVVHVEPGYAIDCYGNEVVVQQVFKEPLPDKGEMIYLCVEWAEHETDLVPVVTINDREQYVASRVEEHAMFTYETTCPCARHRRDCKKGASCGNRHGIALARLIRKRRGWKIDERFRNCRARV